MRSIMQVVASCSLLFLLCVGPVLAQTPPAGQPMVGVTSNEVAGIAKGWSAKKDIIDQNVYNEANEKIGEVNDIIVTPDKSLSYAVVSVGGFLGMGARDVAVPINQIKIKDKRMYIPWATKEALKSQPEFKYTR